MMLAVILTIIALFVIVIFMNREEDLLWEDITAAVSNRYDDVMKATKLLNSNGIVYRFHNIGSMHAEGCSIAGTTMFLQVARKDALRAKKLLKEALKP